MNTEGSAAVSKTGLAAEQVSDKNEMLPRVHRRRCKPVKTSQGRSELLSILLPTNVCLYIPWMAVPVKTSAFVAPASLQTPMGNNAAVMGVHYD